MTPPENDRPDEDGGTFKLKPGAGAPGPAAAAGEEEGLDRTMKIQKQAATPPPPPSPLGNPTGPADPPAAAYAETSVMPQQGGSQTGFQPATQQPPQPQHPLGGGPMQQPPMGQQPYGQPQQQPFPGQPPQQQPGYPQPQAAGPQGEAPEGVKRIGLMMMIGAGVGLITSILIMAMLGGFAVVSGVFSLLFALAFAWFGWALPKGKIASSGLRQTGVILMMIGAGFSILGIFSSFSTMAVFGGLGAISLVQSLVLSGVYGYGSFIYFKDEAAKAYIKGAPAMAGGYPPPGGQPGYQQQPYGQQQAYGQQPQQPGPPQGQPGAYPPPPPGYPQQGQHPPQPPYGG